MNQPAIRLEWAEHKGKSVVLLHTDKNQNIINAFRNLQNAFWSQTKKCWYIEKQYFDFNDFYNKMRNLADIDYSSFKKKIQEEIPVDIANTKELSAFSGDMKIAKNQKNLSCTTDFEPNEEDFKALSSVLSDEEEIEWFEKNVIARIEESQRRIHSCVDWSQKQLQMKTPALTAFINNPLSIEVTAAIDSFCIWMRQRRYSENTIETYRDSLNIFLRFFYEKAISEITNEDLINFNDQYIIACGLSASYQNQVISAIRLFFINKENVKLDIDALQRPRRYRQLPKVISKPDVERFLKGIKNIKHKIALTLIYACGLRRSEILDLKCEDICFERKALMIINAKGHKDRIVPISDKLIAKIKEYMAIYKPVYYFIEGANPGTPYSATSILGIFHKNMEQVLPGNKFTLHCLRHSYATHLLESGTDLRYIQTLLGHKSSKTTEIYTWVSMKSLHNIKNPTDDFDL